MKRDTADNQLVSEVNKRLIMQSVRAMQPTSRAAIVRHTGLSPATVTSLVASLTADELLEEAEPLLGTRKGSRGGRPPVPLRVNTSARHVLAVDLEPDVIRVALTDVLARPVIYRERIIDRRSKAELICRQMAQLCREVLAERPGTKLLGTGLCLPGLMDVHTGVAISSTNMPHWRNVPVRERFEEQLGAPLHMVRSMHAAALHELWLHPELKGQHVALLTLRTGIGMALIDRGRLYEGRHGFAGEIGHTVMDPNGPRCECGARGCLETYASASAIVERAQRLLNGGRGTALRRAMEQGAPLRTDLIYQLARDDDADCRDIVRNVAGHIGMAAANLVNLLAPDCLILCGSIDMADKLVLETVEERVRERALPRLRERLTIRLASDKQRAPLLGAAALVAGQLFELPRLSDFDGGALNHSRENEPDSQSQPLAAPHSRTTIC